MSALAAAFAAETIWMKRRTRLQGWLAAASLFSMLALPRLARAADAENSDALPTTSGAESQSVKSSTKEIETTRALPVPTPVAIPVATPVALRLKPRSVFLPLHMPKPKHEEVRIWGLTIPTFVAYGLSGVSAGGAVLTGFAATRGNDPSTCDGRCTENHVRQRALWITTGVLTGMAVAGLSVGITFMVKAQTHPERDAIKPRLDLGFSGTKAEAKIGWVFSGF
jgi:hypothetical protein